MFDQLARMLTSGVSPSTGKQPTTPEYLKYYRQISNGPSPRSMLSGHRADVATYDRRQMDAASRISGAPRDLDMRNAQHSLIADTLPTGMPLFAIPFYSASKWVSQNIPSNWGLPADKKQQASTRPSWGEVRWGLSPIFGDPTERK